MCVEAVTLCRGCYAPHTNISHTIMVLGGGERLSTLHRDCCWATLGYPTITATTNHTPHDVHDYALTRPWADIF